MITWTPTEEQLICRDLMHAWQPETARREKKGYVRTLRCTRCRTQKIQRLDRDGYIVSTKFVYEPGYVRPGEGRMTRADRAVLRVRNCHVHR